MLKALKPDGFIIFTVGSKHLGGDDPFHMRYADAIERLEKRGAIRPIARK